MQKADGLRLFQFKSVCVSCWVVAATMADLSGSRMPFSCGGIKRKVAFLARRKARRKKCEGKRAVRPLRGRGEAEWGVAGRRAICARETAGRPGGAMWKGCPHSGCKAGTALAHPTANHSSSVTFCGGGGIRRKDTCGRRYGEAVHRPSRLQPAQFGSIPPEQPNVRIPSAQCRRHHPSDGGLSF